MSAKIESLYTDPALEVSLSVSSNEAYTTWLAADMKEMEGGSGFQTQSLTVSVDGKNFYPFIAQGETVTGQNLTARVPLEINTDSETVTRVAELYLDGNVVLGRYATADQAPAKFITAGDMEVSLSFKQADGSTDYEYADESHTIYLQDNPKIAASYQLKGDGFSFIGADQLVWSSSDETVAQIAADGSITPTGQWQGKCTSP